MDKLFRGGMVFEGNALCKTDVLVQNGLITQVGQDIPAGSAQVVECAGMLLSPGFVDLHVHLREPGFTHKENMATATAAGAAGGYTTLCSMPNLNPVPDSLQNLQIQLEAIAKHACIQVLPYGAITQGQKGEALADYTAMVPYTAGFSDDGRGVASEELMAQAMEQIARAGSMVVAHCEVDTLLPRSGTCVQAGSKFAQEYGFEGHSSESEWAEVERDIRLTGQTGCPLHICHTSAGQSFRLVREAKKAGLPVTCEVTPHNLLLSCNDITENDGRFKMNPPLREPEEVAEAVEALLDGTIDAIATDHAPHTPEEKSGGFTRAANGVVGLETAFAVLYTKLVLTGRVPLALLLQKLTTGPAAVLGQQAPCIAPGMPANLTLLDLAARRTVNPAEFASMGRSTPFAGWVLQGWPVLTLYHGKEVYNKL